jgi:hypothetical protein
MPNHVGIYPPFYVFFHGQLCGAFSYLHLTMLLLQLLEGINNTQKMIHNNQHYISKSALVLHI